MSIRIQLRRDTAANWTSLNPVLRVGEVGIETDTLKMKLGNGESTWTQITNYMNMVPNGNETMLDYVPLSDVGAAFGVAGLDANKNVIVPGTSVILEGATADSYETILIATDPTADRTITLPDASGTIALTTDIPSLTTDNVTEGTNKYFTDERAQDAIASALSAGTHTNITVSYDDNANAISLTGAQTYNDENARDAVAGLITGATHDGVSVAYTDDGANAGTLAFTNTDKGSTQNIFKNIVVGATTVVADSNNDTLTIVGSNGVGAIANATNDVIEIYNTGVTEIAGTTNEVNVSASTGSVTIGLSDDVTITNNLTVTGDISSADSLSLATTAGETSAVGKLFWDTTNGTAALGLAGGNVTLQLGQEQVALVYNGESTTLVDGEVVYLYGAHGDKPEVRRASNSSESTSTKTFGMVTEPIAAGAVGFVTTQGVVNGLDMSAYTTGDILWLGSAAGTFTTTKPSAPDHTVFVGVVLRDNHGNGGVFVKPQNGYELEELHNVDISSVANNDILKYDSATSTWKNTKSLSITDLTLSGNLTVNGTTTTVNTASLNITDPMIYMGDGNSANLVDLGIVSAFNDGTYQHTGLVRDSSADKWKLFKGVTDEPTSTINFSQGSLDTLAVGALETSSLTVGSVSNTEIGYLDGVTSGIQSQIDGKISASSTDTLTNKTIGGTGLAFNDGSNSSSIYPYGNDLNLAGNYNLYLNTTNGDVIFQPHGSAKVYNDIIATLTATQTLTNKTITGTFTGNLTGNVTGNVSGNAGTVTNGVYTTNKLSALSSTSSSELASVISDETGSGSLVFNSGPTLKGAVHFQSAGGAGGNNNYLSTDNSTGTFSVVSGYPLNLTATGNVVITATGGAAKVGSDTIATLTATQTLTGKTISGASNTLSNIGNSSLTNSSITINGSAVSLGGSVTIDALPTQTGNSGKYLTTDGSSASWANLVVPIKTGTATVSANTATVVDSATDYTVTGIEYTVHITQGTKIRTSKVLMNIDSVGSVDITEYAIVETNGSMSGVAISGYHTGSIGQLQVTITDAASTNATVKISKVEF